MEYLKIAQDLEMYGVSYFAITVSTNDAFMVCPLGCVLHCALNKCKRKHYHRVCLHLFYTLTLTAK